VSNGKYRAQLLAGVIFASLQSLVAAAQTPPECPPGTSSCSISTPNFGDTTNPSSADNAQTTSSLSGTSSASNASDVTISPELNPRINQSSTQNPVNTTTGQIAGGNTDGTITGGNVTGGSTNSTAHGGSSSGNS